MKLKAFSLIEIIVAMFLSAIVISAVYSGYLFTHKQFFRFTSIKTEIRNYFQFSEVLNREFETSKRVLKKGARRLDIEMIDKTINYSFENDFIVRSIDEQTDTFFFKIEGIEINGVTIKNDFIIDHLVLSMDDDKAFSFYKPYGAIVQIEEEDGDRY